MTAPAPPQPEPVGELLTEAEVAARLRVSRRTLQRMSAQSLGPTRLRIGVGLGQIRYPAPAVEQYLHEQMQAAGGAA